MKKTAALAGFAAILFAVAPTQGADEETLIEKVRASVENYSAAWVQTDEGKRMKLLEDCWAEHGTYTNQTYHLEGREAMAQYIGNVIDGNIGTGTKVSKTTGIHIHHTSFRYGWDLRDKDGNVVLQGTDYGEFDDDGKITKIVAFFGEIPPLGSTLSE